MVKWNLNSLDTSDSDQENEDEYKQLRQTAASNVCEKLFNVFEFSLTSLFFEHFSTEELTLSVILNSILILQQNSNTVKLVFPNVH
jgi:hypothetical protein